MLSPKKGVSLGDRGGGWSRSVFMATPGIPGDSGSALLNAAGQAVGVVSTVAYAPVPLSNGVGDLYREMSYMSSHTALSVLLATGTQPFNGNRLLLL